MTSLPEKNVGNSKTCLEKVEVFIKSWKVEVWLKETLNLWLFVLIAALSFVLFSGLIDQVLEVYRVLALNPAKFEIKIFLSIFLVLSLCSLLIGRYSALVQNQERAGQKESPDAKGIRDRLILLISSIPIFSLFLGTLKLLHSESPEVAKLISIGFIFITLAAFTKTLICAWEGCKKIWKECGSRFNSTSKKILLFSLAVFSSVFIAPRLDIENTIDVGSFFISLEDPFVYSLSVGTLALGFLTCLFYRFSGMSLGISKQNSLIEILALLFFISLPFSLGVVRTFSFVIFSSILPFSALIGMGPSKEVQTTDIYENFWDLLLYPYTIIIFLLFLCVFHAPFNSNWVLILALMIFVAIYFLIVQCFANQKILPNRKIFEQASVSTITILILVLVCGVLTLVLFGVVSWVGTWAPYPIILNFQGLFTENPIGLAAIFLIMLFLNASNLYFFGYYHNIQGTAFLLAVIFPVVLAVGISSRNLNDNHQIRFLSSDQPSQISELPTLDESFEAWMGLRNDEIDKFYQNNKKPYPIYMISAQGGGIFAAYHAASTLSRLQDLCPAFASHVFAISGVSGGSLGVAAFSSLVKASGSRILNRQDCLSVQGNDKPPHETLSEEEENEKKELDIGGLLEFRAHQILDRDFLSPLLSAGLFLDFFQRFIPYSFESLDRARGLEYAFEDGWKDEWMESNPLKDSYYKHWSVEDLGNHAAPALVLNTTVVETGERLLLSPFTFNSSNSKDSNLPRLKDISSVACKVNESRGTSNGNKLINFPLSTAAVLSARFPIVTPVGWFKQCDSDGNPSRSRLADGGYFENSGFTTAYDIGQRLDETLSEDGGKLKEVLSEEDSKLKDKVKIVYLALTNNDFLPKPAGGLNELSSPLLTLSNSKEARSRYTIEQAKYLIEKDTKCPVNADNDPDWFEKCYSKHRFRQFYLTHVYGNTPVEPSTRFNKLPLGWFLSAASQKVIRDRVGDPNDCKEKEIYEAGNNNHCVMKSVIDELSPS